jgi:pimeloyl-ACP methyl ester carboxylesterase
MTLSAPTRRVDIGGRSLAVRVQGAGPVVVLEPGGGANSLPVDWHGLDWWNGVDAKLAESCTVVTYDRAGLGSSDVAEAQPRTADRARDLAALLDALNIRTPVIVAGHSFGGLIAQHFCAAYPERVAGVLLIDPTLADAYSRIPAWIRWLPPLLFRVQTNWLRLRTRFGNQAEFRRSLRARWGARLPPAIADELLRTMSQPRGWDGILMETRRLAQSCADVQSLIRVRGFPRIPLIVISAGFRGAGVKPKEADPLRRSHEATAALVQGGELRIADGVSHVVLQEAPDLVQQAVRDLLTRATI